MPQLPLSPVKQQELGFLLMVFACFCSQISAKRPNEMLRGISYVILLKSGS